MSDQIFYVINPTYGGTVNEGHVDVYGGDDAVGTNAFASDIIEMDAAQLQEYYEGDPLLQNQFGSYDNYQNYMTELSGIITSQGNWWDVTDAEAENAYNVISDINLQLLNGESVDVVQTLQDELGISAWEAYQYIGDQAAINLGTYAGNSLAITLPDGSTIDMGGTGVFDDLGSYNVYDGTDTSITQSPLTDAQYFTGSSGGLYNQFFSSQAVQDLNERYGLSPDNTYINEFVGEDGDVWSAQWNGTGWTTTKVREIDSYTSVTDIGRAVVTALVTGGMGAGLSTAVQGATGWGAVGSTAAGNVLSSALVQGVTTGSVDPTQLVTAGILGGIEGLGAELSAGNLTGTTLDNAVWDLAGTLDMSYDEALNMLQGVASGAVTGQDLETIALGAVGDWSSSQIQNYLTDTYGSTLEVDNWFDEGVTEIPVTAFEPVINTVVDSALTGDLEVTDAIQTLIDYDAAGGSFGFADPGLGLDVDLGIDPSLLPGLDLNIDLPDVSVPDIPLPDIELQAPDIPLPDFEAPDLEAPDVSLPEVDAEVPDVEVDTPEADLESPDLEFPDLETASSPASQGKSPDIQRFQTGISYEAPTVASLFSLPSMDNTQVLKNLIVRNIGNNTGLFGE